MRPTKLLDHMADVHRMDRTVLTQKVFNLVGEQLAQADPEFAAAHGQCLELYRAGRFDEAASAVVDIARHIGAATSLIEENLAGLHRERHAQEASGLAGEIEGRDVAEFAAVERIAAAIRGERS